jgi:hypothetical protein
VQYHRGAFSRNKNEEQMKKLFLVMMLAVGLSYGTIATRYVNSDNTGSVDGLSLETGYTGLITALDALDNTAFNVVRGWSALTSGLSDINVDSIALRVAGVGATTYNIKIDSATITSNRWKKTREGGDAVLLINRTGASSVKGEVVALSLSYDTACTLITVDRPDPVGVFYESGVANGSEAWIVISGPADVYFIGSTTHGHLARGFVGADGGYVIGQALSEAVPTPPFASDKHWYEIGHVAQSRTGAGLARTILHFN